MLTRRRVLQGLGAAALGWPLAAWPQTNRLVRIGYLANDPDESSPTFVAFVEALRELGWVRGKNIEIQYETSAGCDGRFPELAAKVMASKPDIFVTTGSPSTRAAKAETDKIPNKIPIVFGSAANPVEQKFVESLARPGGNVTGLALLVQELGPKRLELMKDALPRAGRFAFFYQPLSIGKEQQQVILEEYRVGASKLGIHHEQFPVTRVEDVAPAFEAAARARFDAIEVTAASVFVVNRDLVGTLALKHGLRLMGPDGRFAEAGALLSYGENFAARYRRAAFIVNKILRGGKPADIPVEQSPVFELVTNSRTARTLGVSFPEPFQVRVDRVVSSSPVERKAVKC